MTKTDLTRNQSLVFNALVESYGPLSAYTLLDRLREHGFRAPLQVYRALDKLVEFGMVHRLESLNAFVACAHPHDGCSGHGTVAFMICNTCGHVTEFHDHDIDHRLGAVARSIGFKSEKTTIEVRGLCSSCAVVAA